MVPMAMFRTHRGGRPTAVVCAVVAAFCLTTVGAAPASGQGAPAIGFTDGRWIGSFNYLGTTELGGVPVRYRATGTFELVSSSGGTTGLWDMYLVTVIEGAVANAIAGGPSQGDGFENVTLVLDTVTIKDSFTGLEIALTGDEIPDSGAGMLNVDSTACNAISGTWELPFSGTVLTGSFVANRAIAGDFGTDWQRLQQFGLDLLTEIDEGGPVPVDMIRLYLHDAETVMGGSTERDWTCDDATFRRFNTAALSLGDAMISALIARIPDLSPDELVEVTRMGYRSGAFMVPDLAYPFEIALAMRMSEALTEGDLTKMEYWLPVAVEFGRFELARNLAEAIEDAR
jgi:hypothetical protein